MFYNCAKNENEKKIKEGILRSFRINLINMDYVINIIR